MGLLLIFIFWPYSPKVPEIKPEEMSGTLDEITVVDAASQIQLRSPDYPAVLFGWKRPTPPPTPQPTAPPVPTPLPTQPVATWLTATNGVRIDEEGITWYLFRDQSGSPTVYWLCYEKFTRGWKIVKEERDHFILIDRSNEYWVARKE
ncbi:MAG: hypothetical protein JXR70_06215 [Spirochaetales bacterium]|nr:hypothetical protein [Spirochaetales bacterium]